MSAPRTARALTGTKRWTAAEVVCLVAETGSPIYVGENAECLLGVPAERIQNLPSISELLDRPLPPTEGWSGFTPFCARRRLAVGRYQGRELIVTLYGVRAEKRVFLFALRPLGDAGHAPQPHSLLDAAFVHELTQPLVAIGSLAQTCRRMVERPQAAREKLADLLERLTVETDRARELVTRLKHDLRQSVEHAVADLGCCVRYAVDLLSTQAAFPVVEQRLPSHAVYVRMDSIAVQQVLVNLLRNAWEANQAAGRPQATLSIAAECDSPGWIDICIRDSGPGFDSTSERLAAAAAEKSRGMGLGLTISRQLVATAGGSLDVAGGEDGATVRLRLPTVPGV